MRIKYLFIVTAVVEVGTGAALAVWPWVPVTLLLGSSPSTIVGITVGRVAGAALLALGAACWLARNDERSPASRGLIAAMLSYNIAAVVILGHAGLVSGQSGVGLRPAVLLHMVLAAWCVACLRTSLRADRFER